MCTGFLFEDKKPENECDEPTAESANVGGARYQMSSLMVMVLYRVKHQYGRRNMKVQRK